MLQKWLLWLSSRIDFMVDYLYFFSLQSGFTLGKWLLSFAQDSSKLSSVLTCFGDHITNKNTKTCIKWLKLLSRVLNMPIELKGLNYYSKVFKRINYRLSNSTFWVVIRRKFHNLFSLLRNFHKPKENFATPFQPCEIFATPYLTCEILM